MRREFLKHAGSLALFATLGSMGRAAHASTWPTKPVSLVLGYPPGGATDVMARLFATFAAPEFGQPVVVDNKPGANGTIGANHVAKSTVDRNMIFVGTGGDITVAPTAMKGQLPYDPKTNFVAITELVKIPAVLVVGAELGIKTVPQLVDYLKKSPGAANYASFGPATNSRILGELFQRATGTQINHVPYKGSAPAIVDLLAGRVHMFFDTVASAYPHIQAGKLNALAVTSETRVAILPDQPTMIELGLPSVTYSTWIGLLGPAGMSPEAARRVYEVSQRFLAQPEVQGRIKQFGMTSSGQSPQQFKTFIATEIDRLAKFAVDANLKFD